MWSFDNRDVGTLKTDGADFSEIDKRGGSNKARSWEHFLKKNKKNSCLLETSEY